MKLTCVEYSGVTLVLYIIYMTTRRTAGELQNGDQADSSLELLQSYGNSDRSLSSLRDTISSLDTYLANSQKRTCQFGLNSHHCALSSMDNALNAGDWLGSGYSPGKRTQATFSPELESRYAKLLADIVRKREHLAVLNSLLDNAENKVNTKSKRTCMFNLGGRCATELASAIADQYYYLNSANSPGRKRRSAPRPINPN